MKRATTVLVFIMLMNMVAWLYADAGIEPVYGLSPALRSQNLFETFNTTKMMESWSTWSHDIPWAGDIVAGTMFIMNAVSAVVKIGFVSQTTIPTMLIESGLHSGWVAVYMFLYVYTWYFFMVDMLSGRTTLDEGNY